MKLLKELNEQQLNEDWGTLAQALGILVGVSVGGLGGAMALVHSDEIGRKVKKIRKMPKVKKIMRRLWNDNPEFKEFIEDPKNYTKNGKWKGGSHNKLNAIMFKGLTQEQKDDLKDVAYDIWEMTRTLPAYGGKKGKVNEGVESSAIRAALKDVGVKTQRRPSLKHKSGDYSRGSYSDKRADGGRAVKIYLDVVPSQVKKEELTRQIQEKVPGAIVTFGPALPKGSKMAQSYADRSPWIRVRVKG